MIKETVSRLMPGDDQLIEAFFKITDADRAKDHYC